jgi:hypothetical protein
MNRIAYSCAFVVVIVVSACSTAPSRYGEAPSLAPYSAFFSARVANSTVPAPDQPHGYLLASIGMGKGYPLHGRFEIWFRKKGEPRQSSILFDNRTMLFYPPSPGLMIQPPRIEFLEGPKEVAVVVVPFTPGDYELFWYEYFVEAKIASSPVQNRSSASLSQSLPRQQPTLESMFLWETVKDPPTRGLLGVVRDNRFIEVSDSFQRDFDSAEKAGRGLKGASVLRAVPRGSLPEGFQSRM